MDDNTYECPHCGAVIYPEMTRCPECGQNMYPEDELEEGVAEERPASGWVSAVGGLLIGWMVAAGIATLIHFILSAFVPPVLLGWPGKTILILAGPAGTFIGGWLCAAVARQHTRLLGGIVGVLSLPILVLLATTWKYITLSVLFSPWMVLLGAVTILCGVAGGWIYTSISQSGDWKERWRVHGWEDLLYQELLRKVRFNGSAADRLIEYERQQNPQASRLKCIQNALERWERDNR